MAKPLPAYYDDPATDAAQPPVPEPELEARRHDAVALAISNHVNELVTEYVREAIERYKERLMAAGNDPEKVKGPQERPHLNAPFGRAVLAGVTEIIFTAAMRQSYFRFPDGYGSFRVQRLRANPKPKRLPTGVVVEMPPDRVKFKYEDGAAVREVLNLSKKTNYVRRYIRQSKLSPRTQELLPPEQS
jgi:hypothetical protein